ncbi:MAG: GNAT family N-acetyltransferase [candidate division Zixibacteria bacterium]|nr:GNAT family N-acetyltransferase [candidate division Zixibacteria bacterium]
MVFQTDRLVIRKAEPSDSDVEFFYRLCTDPKVMTNVGFPYGLKITREAIRSGFEQQVTTEFNTRLVVELKATGEPVGECKLGSPDENGISETDIKLLPQFWGKGYGTEIKRGLVDYLFTHTACRAVKASPNKNNIASQRMQEKVGGKKVGEHTYRFPEEMRAYTVDVESYIYQVFREDWERLKK